MYNKKELPKIAYTAGRITILTAVVAVSVFVMAFLFDSGANQIAKSVHASGTASTTLTVLNTPPSFTLGAYEVIESSTSSPTNSGDSVTWSAIANDSNGAPYFLLICSTANNPVPNAAASSGALGTAAPACSPTSTTQWGVSAAAASDALATVATTTTESFAESNDWYAWVCDDDPVNPRCNAAPVQGLNATNSSPFFVNHRPTFGALANNGPVDPGGTLVFNSTSSDSDTVDTADNLFLVVCQTNTDYNTTTNTCDSNFLASTTISLLSDATATYTLAAIVRDDVYPAYGYIVDEHGHEAAANPIQADFTVSNVAPEVLSGDISLNSGAPLSINVPGGETTGFTLSFTASDANSCVNVASTSEMVDYNVSVYRSGVGTSTCDGTLGAYNPNNCYTSGAAPATWNLSCTASTTSCTGPTDDTQLFNCTFPLWFVADPTDNGTETPVSLEVQNWTAAVAVVDDNADSGPLVGAASPVELISFNALDLLTAEIPYGALEPGNNTGATNATTTINNIGNTALDQEVEGEAMCDSFAVGNECVTSSTSTIAENNQQFSSTTFSYGAPGAVILSSSTVNEVELDIVKTTSTSTFETGDTFWGIAVPGTITLAGSYRGLNTFYAVTSEADEWGASYPNI